MRLPRGSVRSRATNVTFAKSLLTRLMISGFSACLKAKLGAMSNQCLLIPSSDGTGTTESDSHVDENGQGVRQPVCTITHKTAIRMNKIP